jgi:hypothetical protein
MSKPRYYVDKRVGCVAVRDSTLVNPDEPGLWSDSSGVIKHWHGQKAVEDRCPTCGTLRARAFVNTEDELAEAKKLCDELNAQVCRNSMKWPPLDPGTKVRTTLANPSVKGWLPECLASRQWNVKGTILKHHDSHGLSYEIRHEDGTVGHYDPSEFDVIE